MPYKCIDCEATTNIFGHPFSWEASKSFHTDDDTPLATHDVGPECEKSQDLCLHHGTNGGAVAGIDGYW